MCVRGSGVEHTRSQYTLDRLLHSWVSYTVASCSVAGMHSYVPCLFISQMRGYCHKILYGVFKNLVYPFGYNICWSPLPSSLLDNASS